MFNDRFIADSLLVLSVDASERIVTIGLMKLSLNLVTHFLLDSNAYVHIHAKSFILWHYVSLNHGHRRVRLATKGDLPPPGKWKILYFIQTSYTIQMCGNHLQYDINTSPGNGFYQRVSIASYASAGIARAEMSVCLSVRHTPVLYQNEES